MIIQDKHNKIDTEKGILYNLCNNEWEASSKNINNYVWTFQQWLDCMDCPKELLPYFRSLGEADLKEQFDSGRMIMSKGDVRFNMMIVLPEVFMRWFNIFFEKVKKEKI